MAQYIDKDALENILRGLWKEGDGKNSEHRICYNKALQDVQCEVDTIEVKDVELEANIQDYINSHFTEGCDGSMISDWYKVLGGIHYKDLKELAKHFFELGMATNNKAQKGE